MADIEWDTSSLQNGLSELRKSADAKISHAVDAVANEILRLSQFEVPHDTGNLQNSGAVDDGEDEYEKLVGYNTVYAAFQHEGVRADGTHVVTNWQAGRKKKYLEDPIRHNYDVFLKYFEQVFEV